MTADGSAPRRSSLSLTWSDVSESGRHLSTRQAAARKRSRQRLLVPMYDELSEALALCERRGPHVLTSANGRPWHPDSFRHAFKKACERAGVPGELTFHDLRGSALKAFADAGASELEIRAISGHSMKALPGALSQPISMRGRAWPRPPCASARTRDERKLQTTRKVQTDLAVSYRLSH